MRMKISKKLEDENNKEKYEKGNKGAGGGGGSKERRARRCRRRGRKKWRRKGVFLTADGSSKLQNIYFPASRK